MGQRVMKEPIRFGRFLLHRRIGVGGMAEVWLATRQGPHGFAKEIALKRILPGYAEDPNFVRAFLHEGRIGSALRHPNIVEVIEAGEVDGIYYLAMEYVCGQDLRAVLEAFRRARRFPPLAFTLNLIADLCAALDHVHDATGHDGRPLGLVHRDISPHNLLLSHEGRVKLTDFGIVKAVDQGHRTQTGVIKGKIAYMAPEQARLDGVDRRTDIYQTGIVFYELLCLQHPFLGSAPTETLARIASGRTRRPRQLRPELPQIVEDCVRDALRPRREDRYRTAGELGRACEFALAALGLPRSREPIRAQMALLFPEAQRGGARPVRRERRGSAEPISAVRSGPLDDLSGDAWEQARTRPSAKHPSRSHPGEEDRSPAPPPRSPWGP